MVAAAAADAAALPARTASNVAANRDEADVDGDTQPRHVQPDGSARLPGAQEEHEAAPPYLRTVSRRVDTMLHAGRGQGQGRAIISDGESADAVNTHPITSASTSTSTTTTTTINRNSPGSVERGRKKKKSRNKDKEKDKRMKELFRKAGIAYPADYSANPHELGGALGGHDDEDEDEDEGKDDSEVEGSDGDDDDDDDYGDDDDDDDYGEREEEREGRGGDAGSADSPAGERDFGEDHGYGDLDLTHTRALAAALGLLHDLNDDNGDDTDAMNYNDHDAGPGMSRNGSSSLLSAENATRSLSALSADADNNLAARLGHLHSTINANNTSQQILLTQLLQQQASASLGVARGSTGSLPSSQGHLSHSERLDLENAHRARELETRMEMLELLDMALNFNNSHSSGIGSSEGGASERVESDRRSLRRSMLDGEDGYLPGTGSLLPQGSLSQRNLLHRHRMTEPGPVTGPGSTPGLSSSSADTIRRALGGAGGDGASGAYPMRASNTVESGQRAISRVTPGICVERWNVDLSSPFVEYSPDAKAVLNRSGLQSVSSSMLALSPIYTRGAKVTFSVSIEYLREVDRVPSNAASVAAANAVLPSYLRALGYDSETSASSTSSSGSGRNSGLNDDGHTFSFGLSVLDAMPPMGTRCFGKEPFTWGAYDHRRSSAFSQSATIGSSGILAGVCAAFEEGDTLSLVLDLDPDSVTVLAPADRQPMQAGSSSKREGKGCAHFLLNGSIVHTFPQLDVDKRYVMGATLCVDNCVRLFSRNVCLDRLPELGSRGTANAGISQPAMPQTRAEMPAEMTHPYQSYINASEQEQNYSDYDTDTGTYGNRSNFGANRQNNSHSFDESDVIDMLTSMHASITNAVSQTQVALHGDNSMPTGSTYSPGSSIPNSPHAGLRHAESLNLAALGAANPSVRNMTDYGTNNYGGGTFVREWGRIGTRDGDSTQAGNSSSSSLLSSSVPGSPARNRNPQLSRPASPPRPSPASMRLGQRFSAHPASLQAQMLTSSNEDMQAITSTSTRAAMAFANGGPEVPVPSNSHPPDYSLITPTNVASGFSNSAASWRVQQEQRARHQLALRAQLESQQERERTRQQLVRDSERDEAALRSDSKDGANAGGGTGSGGSKLIQSDAKKWTATINTDCKADSKASAMSPKGDGDEGMCCCCWELPKSVVLLPCRHMCVCEACGLDEATMPKCPMCREPILQRFKVFT